MPGRDGGGHLTTGHAVDGVVDEDHGDVLATAGRMHDLSHADGCQVAITLVGEDHAVWQNPLDAGGHGRGASMGGFNKIAVEVFVGEYRAANREQPRWSDR